ncbi:hypothetical protein OH799_31505 [Nocardia sp. NBC_00881]|uniref:hypothetical protein n=1 Tax=Nocardia sp. NBC_00881 TaxID=2975995 RepID=UPI0038686FF8|nr:hypothetical protein OH799_31505 [Nocardia sp. NBC_00881]
MESVVEEAPAKLIKVAEKLGAEAEKVVTAGYPRWQWRALGVAILVLVVLGLVVARSCSIELPSFPGAMSEEVVPEPLRSAASCQRMDSAGQGEKCVIAANHPMLFGGIAGGRELTFYAERAQPDRLADSISRWRAAGGTALVDGPVYAAIGPSATVWYADTRVGLRLETGTFAGKAAAQTFLSRAGLVR